MATARSGSTTGTRRRTAKSGAARTGGARTTKSAATKSTPANADSAAPPASRTRTGSAKRPAAAKTAPAKTATATKTRRTKPAARAAKTGNHRVRNLLVTAGAAAIGFGAVFAGGLAYLRRLRGKEGHAAPDLALDRPHNDGEERVPDAFRPDPTAPIANAAERESLRPATGPAPSLTRPDD